jgi:NhaA family Na+:H+ antiporter
VIIAIFFSESVALWALAGAGAAMAALITCNRLGVKRPAPYVLLGLVLWVFVLKSGIHATVAGVLLASVIPAGVRLARERFVEAVRNVAAGGDHEDSDELAPDTAMHRVRGLLDDVESPLLRWEHGIAPYVLFFIMPLFALANAGVAITGESGGLGTVGWGVALGLFLGKPLGVTLGAWFGVRMGWSDMGEGLSWPRLHAAAWLAGIGFTMSLFISGLALSDQSALAAKLGLLMGSLAAGIIGTLLLLRTCPKSEEDAASLSCRVVRDAVDGR